jgi:hypothetical protein
VDLPGPFQGKLLLVALGTAGVAFTVWQLSEGAFAMEGQHWVLMLVVLAVGYALGRLWARPAQMVGLP